MSTPHQSTTRRSGGRRERPSMGGSGTSENYEYRSRSPLSPAREVRMRERQEIQGLNSRLAGYIDRVRKLETENDALRIKISRSEQSTTHERTQVRQLFEEELVTLRTENESLVTEKAFFKTENDKMKAKLQEVTPRLKDLEASNEDLKNENQDLKKDLADAESATFKANKDIDVLTNELADLVRTLDELKKQLKSAQDQLEFEVNRRTEAEARLESLNKKVSFEKNIFEQTLQERTHVKVTEIEEIERRKNLETDARVQQLLQDIRMQHEDRIDDYIREKEELYHQKVANMKEQNKERDRELIQKTQLLIDLQHEIASLHNEVLKLNDLLRDRDARVGELEQEKKDMKARMQDRENEKKDELDKLKDILTKQCDEYQNLLDEKLSLDLEISAYRKMLESEEQRMNISPSPGRKRSRRDEAGEGTSTRSKRRKMRTDEFFTSEVVQSTKLIGLEIIEADPRGHLVALQNHTAQEIVLENYEVRRVMGETIASFYFPGEITILPNAITTVHSCCSEAAVSEPPENLIAEDVQQWPVGEEYVTYLYNPDGQEVASRHCRRRVTQEEQFTLDDTTQERCVIV